MPRTMLQLRMESLSRHLDQAQDPSVWKQRLALTQFNVDGELWDIAVEKVHQEALELKEELDTLDEQLGAHEISEQEGWATYAQVQAKSEEVFRECLDLLGGLALRDRIEDERICRIADEYIKELATDTRRRPSFSILGLEVRLSSTLRRVVTMQFPEWTLWTLPMVAHEYAHVVIEESGLRRFAENVTTERVAQLEAANAGGEQSEESALSPARAHQERVRVQVALADALATLLAGPAYAYAALLLRLNPLRSAEGTVTDEERAATILSVLRYMNTPKTANQPPPHGEIVDRLEAYWKQSVAACRGVQDDDIELPATLIAPHKARNEFVKSIVGGERVLYLGRHSLRAIAWSAPWQSELKNGEKLSPPPTEEREHLREALNAAWRARVEATRHLDPPEGDEAERRVEALEAAGVRLCEDIIGQRGSRGSGATKVKPAPRPHGAEL